MHNDHPQGGSQADVRRTASAAPDTDYYHRRARAERAEFLRAVFSCIMRCGWRAWGCIKTKMEGQATQRELSMLSARELRDLGIARSDFGALANGTYFTDLTRCARSRDRQGWRELGQCRSNCRERLKRCA